ncbi:MAG TPA: RHS repeat-associated core domain-containing protein, partial [Chitinophagaceae bacterium]|nr:RHS repeat-associated core domain-containing protein [Chitinophagaceae bacterium]
ARDAQGTVMAVYSGNNTALALNEQHIYGSSRLGIWNRNVDMDVSPNANSYNFTRGNKFFELSNHLGNVLATISDKKIGVDGNTDGTIEYYNADVVSANDYYPGGMLLPGRTYNTGNYAYGFNGKRKDNEMYGEGNAYDFGERIYDPRIVKWLSVDPLQQKLPALSPYNYCYNNPIRFFDPDGRLGIEVQVKYNAETKKYTILKITFTDDLEPRAAPYGSFGVDWFDYIAVYDNPAGNPELANSSLTPLFHVHGDKRTNTLVEAKWYAKLKVDDGPFENEGGGIIFTSQEPNGSEETRHGRYADGQNTIDGLMAMANGGGKLAGQEFEKKGLLEILDKVGEIMTTVSDKKVGDKLDLNDPNQAKVFKELDDIIAKYSPSEPSGSAPKIEPGKSDVNPMFKKPGAVIYHRSAGYKTKNTKLPDGTMGGTITNEPATDTFPAKRGYDYYHPIN